MIDPVLLVASIASPIGAYWWVRTHVHPEYIDRDELSLLRDLIQAQHQAVLDRLERIEAGLDHRPGAG